MHFLHLNEMRIMRKFLTIVALIFTITSSAQTISANLYLEYDVVINNSKKIGKFYGGQGGSIFYFEQHKNTAIEENVSEENGTKKLSVMIRSASKKYGNVETDLKKKQILSSERIFNRGSYKEFIIKESLHFINWTLLPEQKRIGKYTCSKAVGNFKGRQYTVWYAPIATSILGPWKLHGLPGVVVEASDMDSFFYIKLTKIKMKEHEFQYDKLKENKAISCATYFKLKNEQNQQIKSHIQSKLPRGASFQIKKTVNNWLEKSCD